MDSYIKQHYPEEYKQQRLRPGPPGMGQKPQQQVQKVPNGIYQQKNIAAQPRPMAVKPRFGQGQRVRRQDARHSLLKQWNPQCQIQNVTLPQIVSSATCNKRYRITFTWIDQSGRPHRKDINFGQQGQQQYIDHKDPALRDARLAKMQEQTLLNPLHPNFWKFHMLNKYPDLTTSYMKFVQDNNLINRRLVLKKQFRQSQGMSSVPARTDSKRYATSALTPTIASMIPNMHEDQSSLGAPQLQQFRYRN